MTDFSFPIARVGIVGGGQLARMKVQAAQRLGIRCLVLDPDPESPAAQVGADTLIGDHHDSDKLRELVESCDVTTFDFEDVNTEFLISLEDANHQIHPSPKTIAVIQDKLTQKRCYADNGISTSEFEAVDQPTAEQFEAFGYPLVQKVRRGGYDGRGVVVMKGPEDFDQALPVPSLIERFVPATKELAVMVACGRNGQIRCFPVVEMVVHSDHNMLDVLLSPADIPATVAQKAQDLAMKTAEALGGYGMFGVEMFLTGDKQILVNETAPRTHNSGHHTIEACETSQFEQHLRAVLGLPLGSAHQWQPAAMINLLGEGDRQGLPVIKGLDKTLAIPGTSVHLYGKTRTKPYRKMGHATVLAESLAEARDKAELIREFLQISGQEPA